MTEPPGAESASFRPPAEGLGRGLVLCGRVWPGGAEEPFDDGVVVVDGAGRVAALGPAAQVAMPEGLRRVGGPGDWVGPGIVDAHVHLAFGGPDEALRGGVVALRDLGAPPDLAARSRTTGTPAGGPHVAVAGPLLTAPGGYPSRSWGSDGFARFVDSPAAASAAVRELAAAGVDVVKIALEPAAGQPVPAPAVAAAVVEAAHDCGLAVTAHALTAAMVRRALAARVDELAHTPSEPLDDDVVEAVAAAGIPVVSTLQTFFSGGDGAAAARNAARLHRAGVRLVYGSDLGNAGTRPGADPRELERLAQAGLGRRGALRAATDVAAAVAGLGRHSGRLRVGESAAAVVLADDPEVRPEVWSAPRAVLSHGRLLVR